MGVSIKTVGRSVLESMLFLAMLGVGITLMNQIPFLRDGGGIPSGVFLVVLSGMASFVVAAVFPKPTYWRSFLKLFLGALLTIGIFALLTLLIGPAIFTLVLDFLWSIGVAVWDWSSVDSFITGFIMLFFYIMVTIFVVGIIMAGLFAVTNFLVLLMMNAYVDRKPAGQDQPNSQNPL